MDNRTRRRGRQAAAPPVAAQKSSPTLSRSSQAAASRERGSPVRRSSRGRSTLQNSPTAARKKSAARQQPTPIKEEAKRNTPTIKTSALLKKEVKSPIITTTTTYSSVSTSSRRTVDIHSGAASLDNKVSKMLEVVKRAASIPKELVVSVVREGTHTPTTNTEAGSRSSRSMSHSFFDDENSSENELHEQNEEQEEEDDEKFESFIKPYNSSASPVLCRKLEAPREFGGWLGAAALLLLLPAAVYYVQWCCGINSACKWKWPKLSALLNAKIIMQQVIHTEAAGAYIAFVFGILVLSAVLPGRRAQLGNVTYKFNVAFIAILATAGAALAEHYKLPVADFVLKHYLRFCIFGFFSAFLLALHAFLRVKWIKHPAVQQASINVYGNTGNFLIDYALGRQINPKWLGLVEYKLAFYRVSLIATLLFTECFIYKNVQLPWLPAETEGASQILQFYASNIKYNSAALLSSVLLLIYIADAIIFEHHLASSFELQSEGFGCLLLLRYAATPFLLSGVAKYFFDRRIPLTCKYSVYVAIIVLLSGLLLKRFSNAIKYKYRADPTHAVFQNYETIHTFQGRRLLLGGLWGKVRQPNYAGDILALIGLALPLFLRFSWPPLVGVLLLIAQLLHRTSRVQTRNASRYHSSWVRYCTQVPNYLVPRIF